MQIFVGNIPRPLYIFLLQKVFNMGIKELHLVNVPPFGDFTVNLLKMVLKPKFISRVSGKVLNLEAY
jgi:hypothetical protein